MRNMNEGPDPATEADPWVRMTSGLPYNSADPVPEDSVKPRTSREAAALADACHRAQLEGDAEKARELMSELLGSFGEGSTLRGPVHVDYGLNVHVGRGVFANFGLTALDVCEIRIGDHVQIGPHVQLLCPTHPLHPEDRKRMWEGGLPITIEDNVWLGGGAIILAGVTVGHDSVIGAGAVVTKDVPPFSVAVGSPARVVKTIDPSERSGQYALENFPQHYQDQVRKEEGR